MNCEKCKVLFKNWFMQILTTILFTLSWIFNFCNIYVIALALLILTIVLSIIFFIYNFKHKLFKNNNLSTDTKLQIKFVKTNFIFVILILIAIPVTIDCAYLVGTPNGIQNTEFEASDMLSFYGVIIGSLVTVSGLITTIIFTQNSEISRRKYDLEKQKKDQKIDAFSTKLLSLVEYINPRLYMGFQSYSEFDAPISFKQQMDMFNALRFHLSTIKLHFETIEIDEYIIEYLQDIINEDAKILQQLEERESVVLKLNYSYKYELDNHDKINLLVKKLTRYDIYFNNLYEKDYNTIINKTRDVISHYSNKILEEK